MTAGLLPAFDASVYHRRRETPPRTRRKSTVSIWEDVGRAQEFELDPDLGNAADRPADGIRGAKPAPARRYAVNNARAM
jgi:hypothetical protein